MAILEGSIQHCRNTEANWISSDPITIAGQLYFSIDVFYGASNFPKVKFGNGVSLWSERDYLPFSAASAIVEDTIVDGVTDKAPSQNAVFDALALKEDKSSKGAANGYAPLDSSSKVPAANLPSYVDDVLEFANLAAFPVTGESGKIYVALDSNKTYRWSGSAYVEVSPTSVPQATETLLGGGEIATQAEVEDNASTDDTKIVSVKKLWLALAKFKTLIKALFSDVNTGTEDNKFITPLAIEGSNYQKGNSLAATYIPYSTNGKLQSNSPLYVNGSDVVLNSKIKSISGNNFLQISNAAASISTSSGVDYTGIANAPTGLQIYAGNGTNTSTVSIYPNEIQIDSNQIIHIKGTANSILSLNGSKRVTYNVGVGYLKMDGAGAITFDAGITSETNTIYSASWSTQTLANVRKLFYYVNASDSTLKTINLNPTPTAWDEVYIKDKKGDATTNIITISGNGKNIDGVTSIPLNRNNQGYLLKYDGTQWNIL